MVLRLQSLYRRFAQVHLKLNVSTGPITDESGQVVGYVERCEVKQGLIDVEGWVQAERVSLMLAGLTDTTAPTQHREDVAQTLGISPQVGFNLSLPCYPSSLLSSEPPVVTIDRGQASLVPDISFPFHRRAVLRSQVVLLAAFLGAGLRAMPAALGWVFTRRLHHRALVKRAFGLDTPQRAGRLDSAIFAEAASDITASSTWSGVGVTIVMPIYNAFDLVQEALERVVRHTDHEWRLIIIEDASTDLRVRPYLHEWAARQRVQHNARIDLVENSSNLGFIANINMGFDLALGDPEYDGPVIILNSDAMVPPNWASRLIAPLMEAPQIASTTPMTNDGEIVSVPMICQSTALRPGQGDDIDAFARTFHPAALVSEMPTAVGFCMAISRRWLRQEPHFDTSFGRGYGEEVDWCQRVRAHGGLHLVVPGLFVEHVGGASFGLKEKAARVAHNNGIISSRYPNYDFDVQDFIQSDPIFTARLALAMAWVGSQGETPVPIYLAHSMGGGAEIYLETRIAKDLAKDLSSVVLRIGGASRWQVELITPNGQISGSTNDSAMVQRLLEPIKRRHIAYSCSIGDRDPAQIPGFLRALKRSEHDRIEVMFHDFYPLSPSYTLLDSKGTYRGPPIVGETTDQAHLTRRPNGDEVSLSDWQELWFSLAEDASELRVFSSSSADIVTSVWPDLADRINIRPHQLPDVSLLMDPPAATDRPVIGVLGNIGYQKGARVLQEIACHFAKNNEIGLVLIGNIDPKYRPPKFMPVLGYYRPKDIPKLARKHDVTHWLLPAIWPETFSYATHEMLATGLPVLGFDIGAQGEALAGADNGFVVTFDPDGDWAQVMIEAIRELTGVVG